MHTVFPLISVGAQTSAPLISAAILGAHVEISASPLVTTTPLSEQLPYSTNS